MDNEIDFKEYTEDIESFFPPESGYTFLVGAGISMDAPTNMPSALQIVRALLELSAPLEEIEKLLSLKKLRFELVVEKFQIELDEELRFLDYLELISKPNIIHLFLGNIITRGNYVVTTNFDYMIEHALINILDKKWHQDIIPVITKEDFIFYQDPQKLKNSGKYVFYKIHGSKRNIITGNETKQSLITTISSLGKEREEGEIFALEPFKKLAIYNLMKKRTLVVMGYSGNDDFDIGPTLKELPYLKKLIWIEHSPGTEIEFTRIHQDNYLKDKEDFSDIEKLLHEISRSVEFDIILIRTNTSNFIKSKLWKIFLPYSPINELDRHGVSGVSPEVPNFSDWIKKIYDKIPIIKKYRLASQLFYFLKELDDVVRCSERGLSLAKEVGDLWSKSYFLNFLGLINQIKGNYDKAIELYENALHIDEESDDLSGKATDLGNIGSILLTKGEYNLAREKYQEALILSEEVGDPSGIIINLNNLGRINEIRNELELALQKYKKAMEITDEIGDLSRKTALLNNIGMVYRTQGQFDLALENFSSALKLVENLGDLYGKIILLNNIGRIYDEKSNYEKALEKYSQTIEVADQLGDLSKKAGCLNNIGSVHLAQGDIDLALEKYQEALNIEERLGDPLMKIIYLNNIGTIYNNLENYNLAREKFAEALIIADNIGDITKKALLLTKIGAINMVQEDYETAVEKYEEAVLIYEKLGDYPNKAASLSNIGRIYEILENYYEALRRYEATLQVDQYVKDSFGIASDFYNIGRIYDIQSEYRKALQNYDESLKLFIHLEQKQHIELIQNKIREINRKIGN
ncbi:hypothetical protein LCGC14_0646980 [marine sediment metagenome]|uniref:Uncharacterized protein n=1 Tax=marine sediment metagenome TaxID=412755 RepID=A0A0F9U5T3_9ZZZZ|nr:MAG: Tetratricopeptide repeat protein [Candidatus Lokiarchaeum sp. GC14_75]